jgi:Plasmid pRiA4b ORF-3-like protein
MIHTLNISLAQGYTAEGPWEVTMEFDEKTDFYDLANAILKAVGFDNDHMWMFYTGRTFNSSPVRKFDPEEDYDEEEEDDEDITEEELKEIEEQRIADELMQKKLEKQMAAFGFPGFKSDKNNDFTGKDTLATIFPLPDKMNLYFYFDFGDDWKFKVARPARIKPFEAVENVPYPRVIAEKGEKPLQYGADEEYDDDDE